MSVWQRRQLYFRLMTIMIQKQAKHHPNQRRHLIKHPHFQLNTILITKKHPWKNLCWTMDIKKRSFRNNQKVIFEVWQWTLWTFIHIAFKMVIFTPIWKNWWWNLWKFTKCLMYATKVFCWEKFRHLGSRNPRSS